VKKITVRSSTEHYNSEIIIELGGVARAGDHFQLSQCSSIYSSVFILGDLGASSYVQGVASSCGVPDSRVLMLKGGEKCKEVETLSQVWMFLSRAGADRNSLLIGVGGGAITDLCGFAAATYMRGIAAAYIPTTLLAQVDASVGGKTGINVGGIKNLVGSFQQPSVVLIDPETLSTLPAPQKISGFAEIVKHGLIKDRGYFASVTSKPCAGLTGLEMSPIITRSLEIKAEIVTNDERETGPRKLLNFGHTIGHALEGYFLSLCKNDSTKNSLLHGEAVAIGMIAEAYISSKLHLLTPEILPEIEGAFKRAGLPTRLHTPCSYQDVAALLASDKKKRGKEIMWSLIKGIGEGVYDIPVPPELCTEALSYIQPCPQ
jgi:3-dehydroquinate synthase